LVLTTARQVYMGRNEFAPRLTKEVLSIDGDTLTIETTETPPGGAAVTKKLVFNRSSGTSPTAAQPATRVAAAAPAPVPAPASAPAGPKPAAKPATVVAAAKKYVPARTPWGDPDLQGNWNNKQEVNTPLERPDQWAGKRISDISEQELQQA